ncbi:MAG: hypothetical protein LBH43_17790 [Treponema sp.]|jgi:hypothetical protein|nr:hypothetical protein [Treponema sp.]
MENSEVIETLKKGLKDFGRGLKALPIVLPLAFGACSDNASGGEVIPPQPPTTGRKKPLETDCDGGCLRQFSQTRFHLGATSFWNIASFHALQDIFDAAAWESWEERNGGYHEAAPFKIYVNGRETIYGVHVDGVGNRMPCFKDDITAAEAAGLRAIDELKKLGYRSYQLGE